MENVRQRIQAAEKELFEKDGMLKELGMKLHNLTERNAELVMTVDDQKAEINVKSAKITGQSFDPRLVLVVVRTSNTYNTQLF